VENPRTTEQGNAIVTLPAGPWLVFVASSGDEITAMGGTLLLARRSGVEVAIVHADEPTTAVATFLPEAPRIHRPVNSSAEAAPPALAELMREISPAVVFLPSPLEDDPALRQFTLRIEDELASASFAGPCWYFEQGRIGEVNRLIDITDVAGAKHHAIDGNIDTARTGRAGATRSTLIEQWRGEQIRDGASAEAFWAVERFRPRAAFALTLAGLAERCYSALPSRAPLVSVVVRTKDRPDLLRQALGSLVLQDYPSLDVIVVNDGGAPVDAALMPFRESLPLKLIDLHPGVGRSTAANRGIAASSGSWLLMLDDDDVYLAGAVRSLVAAIRNPDSVYFGNVDAYEYCDSGDRRFVRNFGAAYSEALMSFENQIPFVGCLMPMAHVRAVGGVDESLAYFEDWDLYLRLARRCRFEHVDVSVAEYRIFGEAFVTGKGGEALQLRGLAEIYARHLKCEDAMALAQAQLAVKRELIPREVRREVGALEQSIRDRLFLQTGRDCRRLHDELEALKEHTIIEGTELLVSVIVVNFNGRHHLEKCLPALFATRSVGYEVIVVDNGSSDDSVAWLRQAWRQVKVLAQPANLGFGRANLIGVTEARGGYVALLNSDTVVTPDWLAHLMHALLAEPQIAAACSQLRLLGHPDVLNARGGGMSALGFGYDIDYGCPYRAETNPGDAAPVDVLFPTGAAMLMRRPDFLDSGAFDPAFFMYHEDVDLGWRLWLIGRRVVMCPRSEVFHAFGGTTSVQQGSRFRDWMGNRHNLRSLWKHYELGNAMRATARLLALWVRTGQLGLAAHAIFWNAVHVRGTWRERRRLQRLRRVSDAELVDRGLISETVPAGPQIPVGSPETDAAEWLELPLLLPARSSAIGRLGTGWYSPEAVAGLSARATCGVARAFIKVSPGATGHIEANVHLPDRCMSRDIEISCNGMSQQFRIASERSWQTTRLPATADANGILRIDIASPAWRPHEIYRNADFRRLGCFVSEISFHPDQTTPACPPRSVSVIITTFNRRAVLELTLQALSGQTTREFELIVVDDGSGDGTWEFLHEWQRHNQHTVDLKLFRQDNAGQGIARNHGLRHARGELVLFMGDDIIPEPEFVARHLDRHRQVGMPCAIVGYTDWDREGMRVTPLLEHVNEAGHQFGYRFMHDGDDVPYTCFYTSNISLPRSVLGEQPFDPGFRTYGWEDTELGYRLSKRGLRIVFDRSARARHRHQMVLADFYRRQIKVGAAIRTIYDMHPELANDPPLMPPARAPRWFPAARRLVPLLLPVLAWLDNRSIRVPARLYDVVLGTGFWIGRESAPAGPPR